MSAHLLLYCIDSFSVAFRMCRQMYGCVCNECEKLMATTIASLQKEEMPRLLGTIASFSIPNRSVVGSVPSPH
jgi:hypothetical protein